MKTRLPTLPELLAAHSEALHAKEILPENNTVREKKVPGAVQAVNPVQPEFALSGFATSKNTVLRDAAQHILLQHIIEKHFIKST